MKRDEAPMPLGEGEGEEKARPPRGSADDGKAGGAHQGGKVSKGNFAGAASHGRNVQSGTTRGDETEANAPGISSDKKGDDTK